MLDLVYNSNFLHKVIKSNTSLRNTEKRKFNFGDQVNIIKKVFAWENEIISQGFIAGIVYNSESLTNYYYVYGKGFYRASELEHLTGAKRLFGTNPDDVKYINALDKKAELYNVPAGSSYYPVFPAKNTEMNWDKGDLAIVCAPNTFYDGALVQVYAPFNAQNFNNSICVQAKIVLPALNKNENKYENYRNNSYCTFTDVIPVCYLRKTPLKRDEYFAQLEKAYQDRNNTQEFIQKGSFAQYVQRTLDGDEQSNTHASEQINAFTDPDVIKKNGLTAGNYEFTTSAYNKICDNLADILPNLLESSPLRAGILYVLSLLKYKTKDIGVDCKRIYIGDDVEGAEFFKQLHEIQIYAPYFPIEQFFNLSIAKF